jgi:hypothetical protein
MEITGKSGVTRFSLTDLFGADMNPWNMGKTPNNIYYPCQFAYHVNGRRIASTLPTADTEDFVVAGTTTM